MRKNQARTEYRNVYWTQGTANAKAWWGPSLGWLGHKGQCNGCYGADARGAVAAQRKGSCPEQGHRGCSMGLGSERRVFLVDKRSEEVSRWRKQCLRTGQWEILRMSRDHESLSLQEPKEADVAEEEGRAWITKGVAFCTRRLCSRYKGYETAGPPERNFLRLNSSSAAW